MEFVTDRSPVDLEQGNAKGSYGPADLNRVEGNVEQLKREVLEMGYFCPHLTVKTNWSLKAGFSPEEWPVKSQMERYLENVRVLCRAYGLEPELPFSMEKLTWEGANQIEAALKELDQIIKDTRLAAGRCGAAVTGG